jgi:hypothetical protein
MLHKLIAGYIASIEGTAVSSQFTDTFKNGEDFDEQNINALAYIKNAISEVLDADILADNTELQEYYSNLENYLNKA